MTMVGGLSIETLRVCDIGWRRSWVAACVRIPAETAAATRPRSLAILRPIRVLRQAAVGPPKPGLGGHTVRLVGLS
jgi:hypothetical protein